MVRLYVHAVLFMAIWTSMARACDNTDVSFVVVANGKECSNVAKRVGNGLSKQECANAVAAHPKCGLLFENHKKSGRCSCVAPGVECKQKTDGDVDRLELVSGFTLFKDKRECTNNAKTISKGLTSQECADAVAADAKCGSFFEWHKESGRCSCLAPDVDCAQQTDGDVSRLELVEPCPTTTTPQPSPSPTQGYEVTEDACSTSAFISTAAECEAAANALGITWNSCCQNNNNLPYGCLKRSDEDVIWNGNKDTPNRFPCSIAGNCDHGMRWAVCYAADSSMASARQNSFLRQAPGEAFEAETKRIRSARQAPGEAFAADSSMASARQNAFHRQAETFAADSSIASVAFGEVESSDVAVKGAYDTRDLAIAALLSANVLLIGGFCVAALAMYLGNRKQVIYGKVDEPEF